MRKNEKTAITKARKYFTEPLLFTNIFDKEYSEKIVKFINLIFNFDCNGNCLGFDENVISDFNRMVFDGN